MKLFTVSRISLSVAAALWSGTVLANDATDIGSIQVKGAPLGEGMMIQEESAKSRSTVTKEAMDKMPATGNARVISKSGVWQSGYVPLCCFVNLFSILKLDVVYHQGVMLISGVRGFGEGGVSC